MKLPMSLSLVQLIGRYPVSQYHSGQPVLSVLWCGLHLFYFLLLQHMGPVLLPCCDQARVNINWCHSTLVPHWRGETN